MIWASSWLGGSEKGQQDQQQPKIPTSERCFTQLRFRLHSCCISNYALVGRAPEAYGSRLHVRACLYVFHTLFSATARN